MRFSMIGMTPPVTQALCQHYARRENTFAATPGQSGYVTVWCIAALFWCVVGRPDDDSGELC